MNSRNQIYTQPLAVRDVNIGSADDPVGRNTIIGLLKGLVQILF